MVPEEGEGLYVSQTKDNYDASRLLRLDLIRQFRVQGDYVAIVPDRDTLVVTGTDDVCRLQAVAALVKDALRKPRSISGLVLRLDGDEWVPWMPDRSHPAYQDLRTLQIQTYGQNYAEQKSLLDKLHEKTGQDVFVASFQAMQNTTSGETTSYCVWSKGCHAFLPQTDRIFFFEENREPVGTEWARAAAVLGDSMKPLGMFPERYRVVDYPTGEQMRAMGCEKIKS